MEGGVRIGIRDASGTVVRTLDGAGAAGLNRAVWDLRRQPIPQDTTVFDVPSLDVGPRGPLVLPGTYRASFEKGPDAAPTDLEVRWDPLMPDVDVQARYAFTMELYALQQTGYHAQVQAARIERAARAAVDSLRALAGVADSTAKADLPAHVARADSLLGELRRVTTALRRRNGDLRGWWRGLIGEMDGGPSTIGSMTGPNDAQRRRLEWTQGRFGEAVEALDVAIASVVPALNGILEEHGGPGVEVPERESGTG